MASRSSSIFAQRARTPILAALSLLTFAAPVIGQEVLKREKPRDWTLTVHLRLRAWHERYVSPNSPGRETVYKQDSFAFDSATLVFPALPNSASHVADGEVSGEVRIDGRVVDEEPSVIPKTYHSGTRLARWDLGKTASKTIELDVKIPVTAYETAYDEDAAKKIEWPKGAWPGEALSTFQPQSYIDVDASGTPLDMAPIEKLLKKWTNGKDPKSIPPAQLAKWLAGQTVEYFQPSGSGFGYSRSGMLEGIDLKGAPQAALDGRGSEFDMVTLYVALLRQAGIPARIVVGWDKGEEDDEGFLQNASSRQSLRAWTEFCLFDEASRTTTWVPVDVVKIRKGRSRLARGWFERPLKYFGTHDELDKIIPFSFHFHPPTTVIAYGTPGFWGWMVFPTPPDQAFQELRFTAMATPMTAERQRERRNRDR